MVRKIFVAGLCLVALVLVAAEADIFAHGSVVNLLDSDFAEKTSDGKLYFIKFYAPWCGHCKRLAPAWSELADAYAGSKDVVIAHVDCTKEKDVCSKAEIRGYPTLKLFHNGEENDVFKGSRELGNLQSYVDEKVIQLLQETKA